MWYAILAVITLLAGLYLEYRFHPVEKVVALVGFLWGLIHGDFHM